MPKKNKQLTVQEKRDKVPEHIRKAFKDIFSACKNEDAETRKAQIKNWKEAEEFWSGVQYIFWSERDSTWINPADQAWREGLTQEELEDVGPFYDYIVNIYRAHGEAIIASLSAQIPSLRFIPDNADDTNDTVTARTYDKIADLVSRHNKAKMIFLRALFFLWNCGIVASYRYKEADPSYGTYEVPVYEDVEEKEITNECQDCGFSWPDNSNSNTDLPNDTISDTSNPANDSDNVRGNEEQQEQQQSGITEQETKCPKCGSSEIEQEESTKQVPKQTGTETLPKTRVKIDIIGPLFFKINYYATKQQEITYFIRWIDQAKSTIKSIYCPDGKDSELSREIDEGRLESHDRFTRSGHTYPNDPDYDTQPITTLIKFWCRPSEYWRIKDEKVRLELIEDYPLGLELTFVGKNEYFVEVSGEADDQLDIKWEIGQAGLSTYIHSDPIGKPLLPIQKMKNQVVNMSIDVIDHSNPSAFADPSLINFDAYGKTEALPGYLFPFKEGSVRSGESAGNRIFVMPKTSLGTEVPVFEEYLDKDAQFTVGSFPSIYGGSGSNTSRTAKEYEQSRAMALQRLTIIWTFVVDWWVRTVEGMVRTYASVIAGDERFAKWDNGSYINIWIRKSELSGKVGGVESEASEQFPISLMQKRSLLIELIQMQNPAINQALFTPDNARILQDSLALNEFTLPGENQRLKQMLEINDLTKMQPIAPNVPSIPIDADVDDDTVHISVATNWAVSLAGIDCNRNNPAGYMNVIYHINLHKQNQAQKQLQQAKTQIMMQKNSSQQDPKKQEFTRQMSNKQTKTQ